MDKLRNSIKGRLFIRIFAVTSLFMVAVSLIIYHEVRDTVFGTIDETLHSKMQVISGLLHEEHSNIELELSEVVSGEYSIPRSGHYYKVMMNGELFAAAPSLVDSNFDLTAAARESDDRGSRETVLTSIGPGGEPIRVLQYNLHVFGKTFNITVAESLSDSLGMIQKFKRILSLLMPACILVVSFMAMWIAKRSLIPLERFSGRIKTITHTTLDERIDSAAEDRELADLATSFNDMLDRLQEVFESEKRLIADASHELKTPVAVIKLQCDVVLQRQRTAAEYIDALTTIRSVSDNIDTLVKDLLSLARLDSGILSSKGFVPVSLNDCIQKTVTMVEPFLKQKSLELVTRLGDDITIAGNLDSLTEAVFNILENGVKYNRDNGVLEVTSTRSGGEALVSIRDTGFGIASRDAERIFDRFYRADAERNAEGSGLGLSIAKAIIEAHGGRISMESELGQGSTFKVVLPVLAEQG